MREWNALEARILGEKLGVKCGVEGTSDCMGAPPGYRYHPIARRSHHGVGICTIQIMPHENIAICT